MNTNHHTTWMLIVAIVLSMFFLSVLRFHTDRNKETLQRAEDVFRAVEAVTKEQASLLKEQRILLTQLSLTLEDFRKTPTNEQSSAVVKAVSLLTDAFTYYLNKQKADEPKKYPPKEIP